MSNYIEGPDGTVSKMWAVGINMKMLTPQLVQEYKERGILTWCYSPDDEQQVYYAIGCGSLLMTVNNPLPAMRIREQLNQ